MAAALDLDTGTYLREPTQRARALLQRASLPAPGLGNALNALVDALEHHAERPQLLAAQRATHAALAHAALPYLLDVATAETAEGFPEARWLRVYRVEAAVAPVVRGRRVSVLHVRRVDATAADDREDALGVRRAGLGAALVFLDEVERQWASVVLPAAARDRSVPVRALFRRHGAALAGDLVDALPGAPVRALLDCLRAPARVRDCALLSEAVAPAAVALTALAVQTHEAHHEALPSPPVPSALRQQWPGLPDQRLAVASSELSATLFEVAFGPWPRLALIQALSGRWSDRFGPHGLAARVLRDLMPGLHTDLDGLLSGDAASIRERAAATYRALYGNAAGDAEALSGPGNPSR